MQTEMSRQRFIRFFLVTFYENAFIVSRIFTCLQTDGRMYIWTRINRGSAKIETHVTGSTVMPRLFWIPDVSGQFRTEMVPSLSEWCGQ